MTKCGCYSCAEIGGSNYEAKFKASYLDRLPRLWGTTWRSLRSGDALIGKGAFAGEAWLVVEVGARPMLLHDGRTRARSLVDGKQETVRDDRTLIPKECWEVVRAK